MAYDLKLAPEPEHGVMPAITIAVVVLIIVAVVVFLVNPRETSVLKVAKVDLYSPHTEYKTDTRSPHLANAGSSSEDDLYVVTNVEMTDKLRLPLYLTGTTLTLTGADGSAVEATGVSPRYFERLESTFPTLKNYIGAPIYEGDEIDPNQTHKGTVLFLFPGLTEAAWHSKKSAVLTIELRNQAPQNVTLP